MRTFSCFIKGCSVAAPTFIVTSSLERAMELARRELLRVGGISVDICEGGTFLCTIFGDESWAASTMAA
jgi:hypothetical protein